MTKQEFIQRSKVIHGDKYDYSQVEYKNTKTKVCIICPEHGEFWQLPSNHLKGHGCSKCGIAKTVNANTFSQEYFIQKAKEIHHNKYDYTKSQYKTIKSKVCIICPEHGEFWQTPDLHLQCHGCPICYDERRGRDRCKTTEQFITEANLKHNKKYNYAKTKYINNHTKVCIVCPEHGEFWQTPVMHLYGQGCPKCGYIQGHIQQTDSTESFITKAINVHGYDYDYSQTHYRNALTKVNIICPEHGMFNQRPSDHLKGQGCPKCGVIKNSQQRIKPQDVFIQESHIIHGGKYNYSKVEYKNTDTKVCIICPEHGEFWQTPTKHLSGQGCPKCNSSHLEGQVRIQLQKEGIEFEEQKHFDWLGRQSLDFYLPAYDIALECQGEQHFKPSTFGGKIDPYKHLEIILERDKRKYCKCKENTLSLLYVIPNNYQCTYNDYYNKHNTIQVSFIKKEQLEKWKKNTF